LGGEDAQPVDPGWPHGQIERRPTRIDGPRPSVGRAPDARLRYALGP
jgi:hypothetical protein